MIVWAITFGALTVLIGAALLLAGNVEDAIRAFASLLG
jgi:hypothetical protein